MQSSTILLFALLELLVVYYQCFWAELLLKPLVTILIMLFFGKATHSLLEAPLF